MIEIREAKDGDLGAMVELLQELSRVTSSYGRIEKKAVQNGYRAMLDLPSVYRNFVAIEEGRVVGLLSMIFYKTLLHEGGTALINELVVSQNQRRRGIGRMLVEAAIRLAIEQGMDEIEVGTEQNNLAARRFYASAGFSREYVLFGREFESGEVDDNQESTTKEGN
jgi:ribosomal protein S18 acetylase RimI-like enzyme